MAVNNPYICPECAKIAYITKEVKLGLMYNVILKCNHYNSNFTLITPPHKMDTLAIEYEQSFVRGQKEFAFVETNLKKYQEVNKELL